MRLTLERRFHDEVTLSYFGILKGPDGISLMTCEREWKDNLPNVSCVPPGFYALVPHHGPKYPNTFALIGEHVSQAQTKGVARFACVIHWSSTGKGLQGCVSVADSVIVTAGGSKLDSAMVDFLKGALKDEDGPSYLTIVGP